jgi:endoglucanase
MHENHNAQDRPPKKSLRKGLSSYLNSRQKAAKVPAAVALLTMAFTGCAAPSAAPAVEQVASVSGGQMGWLHTEGSKIKDEGGQTQVIKAVSWFGLETPDCVPHGLWTLKMDDGLKSIKSMGFNTVRLPYSNQCITSGKVSTDTNFWANPDLKDKTPQQVMDIFIARAKENGLNVILDRHRPSSASQSELWYTSAVSEEKWIADWKMLAARYKDDPTVIGVDLHNEPYGAAKWGSGVTSNDWQAAATRAGNAVQSVNPKLLIIVEGVESVGDDYYWWGGNLAGVKAKPVTLNTPNQVVYSPHDYPKSVYAQKWFEAADYPNNLESVWDSHWGYIAKENIAPVLLGEFGTKLETESDKQWLNKMVGYLKDNGISYSYWSFNPNSGDTGGIMKTDWRTPEQAKLDALAPILSGTATDPAPVVTPTPVPTATVAPVPTATASPTATPVPTTTVAPTTPAPVPTATATPTPVPTVAPTAPATGANVSATWKIASSWGAGYVANLSVTALADAKSWKVSWEDPYATSIANSWGMKCTVAKPVITCVGTDWTTSLRKGQVVNTGLQVNSTKVPVNPVLSY